MATFTDRGTFENNKVTITEDNGNVYVVDTIEPIKDGETLQSYNPYKRMGVIETTPEGAKVWESVLSCGKVCTRYLYLEKPKYLGTKF